MQGATAAQAEGLRGETVSALPRGYDDWRLRGPEEDLSQIMEACETCGGTGTCTDAQGMYPCEECGGTGEVLVTLDEPDGDYLYEQARDRRMDE